MKKVMSILLSILLLAVCVPLGAIPVAAATSGTTGACTWVLDGTHLTISGEGKMENYSSSAPWGRSITSVTIEDGVTTIGDYAFYECFSLTSVTIGDSVTTIGDRAFRYCYSLTSVTIGDSVTSIGNGAFAYCYSLTSVTIPDSVTFIGGSAFRLCTSLTSVTIPDSVTSIGGSAFEGCESLTSVTIPDSVTSIGGNAFYECTSLTSIKVDENNPNYCSEDGVLFTKDKTTLIQCPGGKIGAYSIPDSVTSIGNGAFAYCTSLTLVTIPASVTSIGSGAFSDCYSLTSVTIPDRVTTIGDSAFRWCASLTSVTIGDSVTSIGEGAFNFCTSLASVTIGNGVTSIGTYMEGGAFYGCDSLTSIKVDENNPNYCSADGVLFTKDKTTLIQCPGGKIGAYSIPDSVTSIGSYAFARCTSLTSVTIPDSVTFIGEYAFYNRDSLKTVHYHGTEKDKAAINIRSYNYALTYATWHYYDNGCDATCNKCNYTREPIHKYTDACDADCNACGAVREVPDHIYDDDKDPTCNECGAVRAVADRVGVSVSEDVSGLAMQFKPEVEGIAEKSGAYMQADYTNATYHGYKLIEMGVVASNGVCETTIKGEYLYEWQDGTPTFAFRVINIPADKLDMVITMTPYYVVEIDGVATTIYGTAQTGAYADVAV